RASADDGSIAAADLAAVGGNNVDGGEDCIVPNLDISVYGAMGTNSEYGYVAANDILVPAGVDMTLNGMLTTLVYEGTGSITSATVRIYADDGNKPLGGAGDAIATRTATPIAENLVSSDFADGIYEVEWAFDPIELSGALGEDVRYWVGLSTTPDDGWTNFAWAVSEYLNLGAHPYLSYGSEFYEYSSDADGSYIFFTTCVPTADAGGGGDEGGDEIEDCGMQVMRDPNSSGEGYNCEATNHTVANDIVVAANTDMYLTAVMPSVIMNPETSVSFATLTVYLDDNGLPGENIANETLIADSQIHQGSYGDMEAYDISFEFDPIYLPGRADQETTYWIGLSLWLQAGTAVLMEVTSEELMGHPVAISSGGNFLIPNEAHEGVISFTAECQEIDGPTDPLPGYCPVSEYEINQDAVHTCFGFVSDGGMFQSFTAEQSESSGAGFKFTEPSRGMEVTISL
ncbi:MAG TPA: hypothetical protein VKY29_07640, partial [Cryomorphaceae bacterium]|nr:hypothetical protein [Cryomorphaceae bacterium]